MKLEEWVRVVLGHRDLIGVLRKIREARKTGSLTIHFGQGSVAALEWKQKKAEMDAWPFENVTCIEKKSLMH